MQSLQQVILKCQQQQVANIDVSALEALNNLAKAIEVFKAISVNYPSYTKHVNIGSLDSLVNLIKTNEATTIKLIKHISKYQKASNHQEALMLFEQTLNKLNNNEYNYSVAAAYMYAMLISFLANNEVNIYQQCDYTSIITDSNVNANDVTFICEVENFMSKLNYSLAEEVECECINNKYNRIIYLALLLQSNFCNISKTFEHNFFATLQPLSNIFYKYITYTIDNEVLN